jgi:4'-phosphopantetheinyl transferase
MLNVSMLHINRNLTEGEFGTLLGHVAPGKRDRIEKYRFFEDRQRVLVGDVLARLMLSKVLSDMRGNLLSGLCPDTETNACPEVIPPDSIVFAEGEYGKPFLPDISGIHFNISHAGNYVTCAVSDSPVGIDVETTDHKGYLEVAGRYFAKDELLYVQSFQNESEQRKAFAEIWTMKEAYIKRDGRGLSILTSFNTLASSDLFFYPITTGSDAAAHVCTQDKQEPIISVFTMDELCELMSC